MARPGTDTSSPWDEPATERFRVGQWVRAKDGTGWGTDGRVGLVREAKKPAVRVRFPGMDAEPAFQEARDELWCMDHEIEPWIPRSGERVRVTKCEEFPDSVGFVGEYHGGERLAYIRVMAGPSNGWQLRCGGAEFEPVFEERESVTVEGVKFITDATVTPGQVTALPPASFNGVEFPPPVTIAHENTSAFGIPKGRMISVGTVATPQMSKVELEQLCCDLRAAVGNERTDCPRPSRQQRAENRKAEALEVLKATWAGRKERK